MPPRYAAPQQSGVHFERMSRIHLPSLFKFQPIYQPRVWGGRGLAEQLGRDLPQADTPYGESWELVDRAEAQSMDPVTGLTLRQLLTQHSTHLLGPGADAEQPFPILVKWLDCRERLSLQVHPPAELAKQLGGEPKTECWYIADASPEASLIVGLKHGATRAQFEAALAEQALEPLLHRFPVQAGQSMLLESGRLHAIDAGNLILEIQQNSDTTYRVYDWGRLGLDGQPRDLHIKESLASIDFEDFEPNPMPATTELGVTTLADSPLFRLQRWRLADGQVLPNPERRQAHIISVVEGHLLDSHSQRRFGRGDTVLVAYAGTPAWQAEGEVTVLVTDGFAEVGIR